MGTWAFEPWDNDEAADWYGAFMEETGLRNAWLKGISTDPEESPETVRAAAALFVMLGRVYVWPIEHYEQDLERAIAALSGLTKSGDYQEVPELESAIRAELSELMARRKPGASEPDAPAPPPAKPWWRLW
jgi:hypothetical protein